MKDFKEFVSEAKQVGTLYHFTKVKSLQMMLDTSNFVVSSFNQEVFSLTRNPELSHLAIFHPQINIQNGYIVRLNIDGDKLSERVKVRPLLGLIDNSGDVFNLKNKYRVPKDWREWEEVIPVGVNIRKYIKSVSILDDGSEEVKHLVESLKKARITTFVSRKWNYLNEWEFTRFETD